jgi:hypothetical protein
MKRADLVVVAVFAALLLGLMTADLLNKPTEVSLAERRTLAQRPALSLRDILDGSFATDYAAFLQDQVVGRDGFRRIKALFELQLLQKNENNGVYVVEGEIFDKFYGINQRYIERAAVLIDGLIGAIDAQHVYLTVIPSKAHRLARDRHLLSDQGAIPDYLQQHTGATYLDLMDLVQDANPSPYYRTDHHWTTQGAIEAYKTLIRAMGHEPIEEYEFEEITASFVGSNYGKAALSWIEKDRIDLAHNDYLDSMSVCRYETAEAFRCHDSVYFGQEANGLDPYDVFLGGAGPIIVIENDRAPGEQELIMFKDSYSHVLAPFLAQHFRKVTLFDLRYVRKELILGDFDLDGKTVLFIYSTIILNTDPQILN